MQNFPSEVIPRKTKDLIEKLLLGKLSLAEIAKVTGITEESLQSYIGIKDKVVS
ncbi:MAG: hypothetical protein KME06_17765 [Kastovskya adunca ATA6-11-RM4]|jgi:hypothetical protein|nr:hypothetical protein [Kastovskya adunca ATA6-11-RM4]